MLGQFLCEKVGRGEISLFDLGESFSGIEPSLDGSRFPGNVMRFLSAGVNVPGLEEELQ